MYPKFKGKPGRVIEWYQNPLDYNRGDLPGGQGYGRLIACILGAQSPYVSNHHALGQTIRRTATRPHSEKVLWKP
jgi:hypothetical protein